MKTRTLIASFAILSGLAAGSYFYWKSAQATDPGAAAQAVPASGASAPRQVQAVSVFAAQRRDVPVTVESAGTVVAMESVDVRPQVTGTVAEVLIRDGQSVKRGQPLFRLDDRADRANVERARAQLARDQATLADLERQWQRAQDLRAQNFISPGAADTVLANLDAQRAAVGADQAALRSAEVALSYTTIAAPLGGRIGAISVSRGSLVQPATASAVMVNINQVDPIGVAFTVPEAQLAALLRADGTTSGQAAATVSVALPAGERGRAAASTPAMQGRVVFVDNAVDTTTGSIRVKAQLPNSTQTLWPGQYVTVRMTLRTLTDVVVVPQAALIIRGNERSLYVVKPDATVEMRAVQTRLPVGEFVVVDGVQAGEKVVVEGKQNLRPGGAVRETPYVPGAGRRGPGGGASGAASGAATTGGPAASAASGAMV